MRRIPLAVASLLATLLAAGCATPAATSPAATTPAAAEPAADCSALAAQISATREAKRVAQEQEQSAWKAIVPFAVMARYAGGKTAAAEADQRLAALEDQFNRQACSGQGK
jgi:hypothetical protein